MIDQEFRAKGGVASGRRHKEGEQDADDLTPGPFPQGKGSKVKMNIADTKLRGEPRRFSTRLAVIYKVLQLHPN
jgi:hypothetical protein